MENKIRVIVAGGRDFVDYHYLGVYLDEFLAGYIDGGSVEIISGGAFGADKLGEDYAEDRNIPIKYFMADWHKHGKSAGPIRNKQMALYANKLICFWDGKSKGTKNMIQEALKADNIKEIRIVKYNEKI